MAQIPADLYALAKAAGITATYKYSVGCVRHDDGTYGPIVTTEWTELVARDARHGNTVVRRLDAPLTADALQSAMADMAKEITRCAKETRARIASERQADRS